MLSCRTAERRVSVWTTAGRVKDVAFTASPEQLATLALYREGESDLVRRDGMWFLNATCEVPEAPANTDRVDFLGIDLGIERRRKETRRARDINHKISKHVVAEAGGTSHALEAVGEHRSRDRPGGPRGAPSTAPAPPPEHTRRGGAGRKRSTTASGARCASPSL